ncbi:hypothetical protein ABZ383_32060 [Streptomyces sp. NPDC005900]|uniref:hypothetical protein n=1 Tax=Streptomyces sp. NPDC005900 TaxID=3154569 RepID=UPI003411AA34
MAHAPEAPATSTTAEGPNRHTQNQAARPSNTFGYTREQQIEALFRLREPFAQTEIRHLPRVWCRACKSAGWSGCQQHPVAKCGKCKQKMPTNGHIDLAYVGHAEATNRLLNVDPFWDWEPLTVDERGLPQVDGYKGLWIRLTVCGMSRLGYGHAGDKTGGDAVKEVIGDAIRNAGMRFGMALDLWTSSDLEIVESGTFDGEDAAVSASARSAPSPSEHLGRLMSQVTDCWKSDKTLIFEQIKADGAQHHVLDEEFTRKDGVRTTLRDVLDGRIAELKAAQGGDTERSAA